MLHSHGIALHGQGNSYFFQTSGLIEKHCSTTALRKTNGRDEPYKIFMWHTRTWPGEHGFYSSQCSRAAAKQRASFYRGSRGWANRKSAGPRSPSHAYAWATAAGGDRCRARAQPAFTLLTHSHTAAARVPLTSRQSTTRWTVSHSSRLVAWTGAEVEVEEFKHSVAFYLKTPTRCLRLQKEHLQAAFWY